MRGKPDVMGGVTTTINPLELAAILAEVRRAILAVDADTGEHRPLRDITLNAADAGDTAAGD
jgi:hypothetical protein